MNLFRNKEIRRFLFLYLLLTIIASTAAALIHVWAVVLVVTVCVTSILLFLIFTGKRYQSISNLSSQIDNILQILEPLEILMDIKNIQLSYNIKNNTGFIGDRLWTTEAIGNILKNCIEHCVDGGSLEIHALENPIYTEIVISDDGPGFEEKEIPHLFDRFYRGSNSSKENNCNEKVTYSAAGIVILYQIQIDAYGDLTPESCFLAYKLIIQGEHLWKY